jgi:Uma2 family endonuclease
MTTIFKSSQSSSDFSEPMDRLWTREEYYKLVDQGFFNDQRVELIEGRIVVMSPQRVPHSTAIELTDRYLRRAFPKGHRIRVQLPFHSMDGSEPEPDLAVIAGDDPRGATQHPSSALLIIEISDTTLEHDRNKARLYAGSGVGEYWIVNLVARSLEVYRQPSATGQTYSDVRTLSENEKIIPLAAPNADVSVAELLP